MSPKVGDVVRLKSGGPAMTVTSAKEGRVFCAWFEGTKNDSAFFPEAALEPAGDPEDHRR